MKGKIVQNNVYSNLAINKQFDYFYHSRFWIVLFSKIIFWVLNLKIKDAQMAEQLDATRLTCFTKVSISANLILGTIDDYILQREIVPPSVKIKKEVTKVEQK